MNGLKECPGTYTFPVNLALIEEEVETAFLELKRAQQQYVVVSQMPTDDIDLVKYLERAKGMRTWASHAFRKSLPAYCIVSGSELDLP